MNEYYIHLRILKELKVIIFCAIKLSSLAVNIFELMIDWRHPDGGLRVLYISCLYEMLYLSFSFFFFDSKYLFFTHVCEYTNRYGVVMFQQLVYSVAMSCERIDIFCLGIFYL